MKHLRPIALATAVASLTPRAAHAQSPDCGAIDAAIHRANTLREMGRDREAADSLRPLLRCGPNPRLVATLGLAELSAALWVEGHRHLSAALATTDPWVNSRRAALQGALGQARHHLGMLEVTTNTPGAELMIGGQRVATLPMREPLRVASGTLTYELVANGYLPETRRVEVAGDEVLTRENVALTPARRAEASVVTTPAPTALAVAPTQTALATPATPVPATSVGDAPEPRGNTQRVLGWTLLGVSAAGLGVGIWGTVARNDEVDTFNRDAQCQTVSQRASGYCVSAQGRVDALVPAMIAGYAVGGAAAIASVILLATAPPSAPRRAAGCAPGIGSIQCSIEF